MKETITAAMQMLKTEKRDMIPELSGYFGTRDESSERVLGEVFGVLRNINSAELPLDDWKPGNESPWAKLIKKKLKEAGWGTKGVSIREDYWVFPDASKEYEVGSVRIEIEVTNRNKIDLALRKFSRIEGVGELFMGVIITQKERLGKEMERYRKNLGDDQASMGQETTTYHVCRAIETDEVPCKRLAVIGIDFPPRGEVSGVITTMDEEQVLAQAQEASDP